MGRALPGTRWLSRDATLAAIVSAWVLLLMWAFFPGLMSADSIEMMRQAVDRDYTNQHPQVLSWLVGSSLRLTGSPWPILLIQLLTLGGGMALLARRALVPWRAALVLVAFLVTPSVWSTAVVIWKDVALAAALLCPVVVLLYGYPVLALLSAVLVALTRLNAVTATAPLIVGITGFVPALARSSLRRVAACALALALSVGLPLAIERWSGAGDLCPGCWLVAHDLVGIYVEVPERLPESVLARQISADDLPIIYSPFSSLPLFFGDRSTAHRIDLWSLPPLKAELMAEWRAMVEEYPGIYALNRIRRFVRFMGLHGGPVFYPYHVGIDPNPWGFRLPEPGWLAQHLRQVQEASRNGIAFRGWFWAAAMTVLFVASLRQFRRHRVAFWISASGLSYTTAFLVVGPAADFRYLFWPVVSVFAALAVRQGEEREPAELHPDTPSELRAR